MQKKPSAKGGVKKRKANRKISDLTPKPVKGGDSGSIKGGGKFMKFLKI